MTKKTAFYFVFFTLFLLLSGPASAELLLTKSFSNDPVLPGGTVNLEFTLSLSENEPSDATGITFTDDLAAVLPGLVATGLPASNVCGTGSQISGTGLLTFTNGTLTPGAVCTFSVVLQVPASAAGSYTNTTSSASGISGAGTVTSIPATDVLQVSPLVLTKSFVNDPAPPGGTVILQFSVANSSAVSTATGITFTDNLSIVLAGLVATGLPVNDICGAGSQLSGTNLLSLTGGSLAPGASCIFSVTLQVPSSANAGSTFLNTTSQVSGIVGGIATTGNAASDNLHIDIQPTFGKSFLQSSIVAGWSTTLGFAINNTAGQRAADGLNFTDNLPSGLLVASPANASTTCTGGTLTAVPGTGVITYTGGALAAGRICSVSVDVIGIAAGAYVNTTGNLISSLGNSGAASAAIIVEPMTILHKDFIPGTARPGQVSTIRFTIDNTLVIRPAGNLAFSDNLPSGLVIASPANASTTCPGGVLTAAPGSGTISFSGGTLAAGSSCTVMVNITAAVAGSYINPMVTLTSSLGSSSAAPATLQVNTPVQVPTVTEAGMLIFMLIAGMGSLYFLSGKRKEL
ncbi:MAG: hypothetical protein C0402_10950 [Thermodesulfovibrio sp.]|nr:hypothetical protein [Thermodesulfovibrio sp.]